MHTCVVFLNRVKVHNGKLLIWHFLTSRYVGTGFLKSLFFAFKGTGTRDLILLKVVSLERSWRVGLTEDL